MDDGGSRQNIFFINRQAVPRIVKIAEAKIVCYFHNP